MATKSKPRSLDLREYWDHVGTENIERVIGIAGTSLAYARQLRYGHKTCGKGLARKIIGAARIVTPGWEPDFEKLLEGVARTEAVVGKLPPSEEFLRSQRKRRSS